MSIITQLPVRLLALALGVLLLPFALETFGTDQITNGLFCAADSLVVGASGAVWVVGCYAALGGDRDGPEFADGVGGVAFGGSLGFGGVGLGLSGFRLADVVLGASGC